MLVLRPYQEAAKEAVYEHMRTRQDNPCVVIPTGAGKTPVIASICRDVVRQWSGRVLVLAHVKELLEQAADKLRTVCPEIKFGIYSSGLGRRDTKQDVLVAGIQSVHKRACDLDAFDVIIVDEAHLIPPQGDGMYRRFLADAKVVNPNVRVIGFTATPYRMKTGTICGPENVLNHVCYEVGIPELIRDNFLCPLITDAGGTPIDTKNLHVRAGEFVAREVENLMDRDDLVVQACDEIVDRTRDRNSVLIFTSGIQHAGHVQQMLKDRHGLECGLVTSKTPDCERGRVLKRFRSGELKYLASMNVLTTGFDAPNVDCVAILRPTMSRGLYYQMCGRGFRPHPGKQNCLVLDFGGNIDRHGPVNQVRAEEIKPKGDGDAPSKECPGCSETIAAGYAICPHC